MDKMVAQDPVPRFRFGLVQDGKSRWRAILYLSCHTNTYLSHGQSQ